MAKVITFSRQYPSYHPKAGQLTAFVEKIWRSFDQIDVDGYYLESIQAYSDVYNELVDTGPVKDMVPFSDLIPKHHTIRAGHRWKAGDWFTPKVWGNDINPKSGRSGPYHSKQIQFAPDIQIKKVWNFDLSAGKVFIENSPFTIHSFIVDELAKNDGLSTQDLKDWFQYPKPFEGQIICWNESIEY